MKIIQDTFSLILKFRSQLVSAPWIRDANTGEMTHPNFNNMVASYDAFKAYTLFLFKGKLDNKNHKMGRIIFKFQSTGLKERIHLDFQKSEIRNKIVYGSAYTKIMKGGNKSVKNGYFNIK